MLPAPIPPDEAKRLAAVRSLRILDTPPEERFDTIVKTTAKRLKAPISAISIIDEDREWFKSSVGQSASEGLRDASFCGHAMLAKDVFIVEDATKDPRFADNPYVLGDPKVRFYAGVALREQKTNQPVGVLCVKGHEPRKLTPDDVSALLELAQDAEEELNAIPIAKKKRGTKQ